MGNASSWRKRSSRIRLVCCILYLSREPSSNVYSARKKKGEKKKKKKKKKEEISSFSLSEPMYELCLTSSNVRRYVYSNRTLHKYSIIVVSNTPYLIYNFLAEKYTKRVVQCTHSACIKSNEGKKDREKKPLEKKKVQYLPE